MKLRVQGPDATLGMGDRQEIWAPQNGVLLVRTRNMEGLAELVFKTGAYKAPLEDINDFLESNPY